MAGNSQKVAALQAALTAEQAASYGYGVVGAQLSGAAFKAASDDCVIHERARDVLERMITQLGATPQPAAAAYRLPITVQNAAEAARLAVDLETEVLTAYVNVVAVADPALRALAASSMQEAAVRAARWGGRSMAFPGLTVPS